MKEFIFTVMFGSIMLLCSSCRLDWIGECFDPIEADTQQVTIINNTDDYILICDGISELTDTMAQKSPYTVFREFPSGMTKVKPGESYNYMNVVYGGAIKYKLYHILIIKENTLKAATPGMLVESNEFDYWYRLTLNDLKANNFVIKYNGQ